MPEREHFTNGRTWMFGTGFGLMSLSFGAHISGWSHWITIGAGYGSGVLLMLLAAVLITKSYFSRQPGTAAPAGIADKVPVLDISDSLEIKVLPMLTPLQTDAVNLSMTILDFLARLGPAPIPRYTWDQISQMPSDRARVLIESKDIDYAEACEFQASRHVKETPFVKAYYPGPIGRWFETVRAKYALTNIGTEVEKLRNRFAAEGLDTDNLTVQVDGRFGYENAQKIAATLWNLAFRVRSRVNTNEA